MNRLTQEASQKDMRQLIGNTLRWGVMTASFIACYGGILYLIQHGSEQIPNYATFSYERLPKGHEAYTSISEIFRGVFRGASVGWMQLGVLALILTPIARVALSIFDFALQKDRLYTVITSVVLAVILFNSLSSLL